MHKKVIGTIILQKLTLTFKLGSQFVATEVNYAMLLLICSKRVYLLFSSDVDGLKQL